jgi:hypothetical protein
MMARVRTFYLLAAMVLIMPALTAFGQAAQKDLPPGFAALVPEGAKLGSHNAVHGGMNDLLAFSATKQVGNDEITYSVTATCFAPEYWRNLKPSYQKMVPESIESARRSMAQGLGAGDEARVVKHSWGGGVIERRVFKTLGANEGGSSDRTVTKFDCRYYGLIGTSLFECRVRGMDGQEDMPYLGAEAEQWAERVASQVSQMSFGMLQ